MCIAISSVNFPALEFLIELHVSLPRESSRKPGFWFPFSKYFVYGIILPVVLYLGQTLILQPFLKLRRVPLSL
jgi:hypothetical protein